MKDLEIPPYQTIVVGDQLFTDIIIGSLLGAYTKTEPLSERVFWTRLVRRVERMLLKNMKKHLASRLWTDEV